MDNLDKPVCTAELDIPLCRKDLGIDDLQKEIDALKEVVRHLCEKEIDRYFSGEFPVPDILRRWDIIK